MDRAVHPRGARAALRALLTGPLGPYVHLVWWAHRATLQISGRVFSVYVHAATRPVRCTVRIAANAVGWVAMCGCTGLNADFIPQIHF